MKLIDKIGTIFLAGTIAYASSIASGQSPEEYGARTMQDKICYSVRDDLVRVKGGENDLRNNVHVRSAYGNPDFPSEPRIELNNCRLVGGSAELCVPASIYLGNNPERKLRDKGYEQFEPSVFPSQLEFENGINPNNIYEKDELCYKVTCDNKTFPLPEGFDEVKVSDINGQRYLTPRRITKICTPARRSLYEVNQRFVKRASIGEIVDEGGFPTGTVKELYNNESGFPCNLRDLFGCTDPDGEGKLPIGYGQIGSPSDLVIDSRDNRVVIDSLNGGVYIYDSNNNFIRRFGEDILSLNSYAIKLDSNENIYVADKDNNRITKFSNQGDLIRHYEGFLRPEGLDIDSQDNLWVADTGNERIVKIDNLGDNLDTFPVHLQGEEGAKAIAIDERNNRFYITRESDRPSIHNITTGDLEGYLIPSPDYIEGITRNIKVDNNGNIFLHDLATIYIFDSNNNKKKSWGGWGIETGQFQGTLTMDLDSNGNIVTIDGFGRFQTFYRGNSLDVISK